VAMKVSFDGSQFENKVMSLAGIAGNETVWREIEDAWSAVLEDRGNLACMHMTDAMAFKGKFKGWPTSGRDFLVNGLLDVFDHYAHDPRLMSSSATVDLVAHKLSQRERNHPSPARLCIRFALPHILEWYESSPEHPLEQVELYFDRGEQFMRHIKADWESREMRRRYPAWEIVAIIAEVAMENSCAVQMADMIAWGRTQLALGMHWKHEHYVFAKRAADTIHGIYRKVDAKALSEANFKLEFSESLSRQFRSQRM